MWQQNTWLCGSKQVFVCWKLKWQNDGEISLCLTTWRGRTSNCRQGNVVLVTCEALSLNTIGSGKTAGWYFTLSELDDKTLRHFWRTGCSSNSSMCVNVSIRQRQRGLLANLSSYDPKVAKLCSPAPSCGRCRPVMNGTFRHSYFPFPEGCASVSIASLSDFLGFKKKGVWLKASSG